jgi:hypothetical protein
MALTRGFTGQKSIVRIKAGFGLTPGKGEAISHPFEASLGGGVVFGLVKPVPALERLEVYEYHLSHPKSMSSDRPT